MIQYLGFWAMSDIGLVVVHVLVKTPPLGGTTDYVTNCFSFQPK